MNPRFPIASRDRRAPGLLASALLSLTLASLLPGTATAASGWSEPDRVDGIRANFSSVALHDGHLSILATDGGGSGAPDCATYLVTNRSGSWHRERVPIGCHSGELAIDGRGRAHIAYVRSLPGDCSGWCPKGLYYATDRGGAWHKERIQLGYVEWPSIAIGPGGRPIVAYHGPDDGLRLATRSSTGWRRQVIGGRVVDFDQQGLTVHGRRISVAFVRHAGATARDQRLVELEGGVVVRRSTVAASGEGWRPLSPDLVVDALGRPHVAFLDGCDGLAHAVRTAAGWRVESVPGLVVDEGQPSMSVVDDRHVAIVVRTGIEGPCSGGSTAGLLLRTNETGTWTGQVIEPKGLPRTLSHTIVTGAAGRSSVVYGAAGRLWAITEQ